MEIETLVDVIRIGAAEKGDAPMISLGERSSSWNDMAGRAAQVAHALTAAGVGAQDRVAFIDKNGIEYFEVLFGGAMINAVNVAVNWRLAPAEMAYIVNDAEAKVLVIHADFTEQLSALRPMLEHTSTVVMIGGDGGDVGYEDWIAGQSTDDPGGQSGPDDVSIQLYTSGTTGLPKGAQISNANFKALLFGASAWAMEPGSVNLVAMPLFHIGGAGWGLFGMAMGAESIVLREADPVELFRLIDHHKITHAFLVPALLQFMLLIPTDDIDLSSMQVVAYGASPITEDVLTKSMEQFGCDFIQVYGLTETSGAVTQLDPEDHDPGGPRAHLLRSAGKAMPGVELKIVDADTGETLPDGEVGEVWIRTPQNMVGYWKLPDATAKALPGDGWFLSGDAAYMEDGYLFIHDRVKDMIVSGGENVYPAEIENALMGHDAIADVAVIGVPDDKWGEVGKALIIPAEGAEVDEAAILAFARERLAGFKVPKSVDVVEAIPRNPSGKILKRELRDPYWEGRDRNV